MSQDNQRLALVIHALYGGGAERLMSQLANRWAAAGHEVHVITLADVATDSYSVDAKVTRHGLGLMKPSSGWLAGLQANWQRVAQLRSLLAELSPARIVSFCDRMNITTISAAVTLDIPLWIAEHSDPRRQYLGLFWETWRQWAYRRLIKRPGSGCMVLTEDIRTAMQQRFLGLDIRVIPPAIAMYDCGNAVIQRESAYGSGSAERPVQTWRVLSMGRHSPEKNLPALLHAWQLLQARFPDWRLTLAGDGPQHAELVELVQSLHIGGSVDMAGWVSDPWSLYRQSSLLAMTSHYEGMPVAMLEAMACGVPCVSTPCASSVIEFAESGAVQLAKSHEPADIAQALGEVMAAVELRKELAERGRIVAQQYSWETIGPRWDALLN